MNKAAIKKFAVESRQKLIKSTIERLEELGITDKDVVEVVDLGGVYSVKSQTLTEIEKKHRDIILSRIQEKGYESFVEEIAYTWFNRIIAIRYMEVNDYLPFRTRVLSSEILGKVDPDLITEIADHIDELELNRDKIITLKETHQQEALFKYVFIKVCNYLGKFLPVMFEQIEDYTELLLPNILIAKGSVIQDMLELIAEEDWTNQVEIIGWLYQYYNEERKNEVINIYKGNVKKADIPAATQLFTTDWVVRYMVDNSLGRYWVERNPDSTLYNKLEFLVLPKNRKIDIIAEHIEPEELTFFDPCMGSGHILVYAFEILMEIYLERGYSQRDAAVSILKNNLFGLDIDDRAFQLAYFAVMMKARKYNRRILTMDISMTNILGIEETNLISEVSFDNILECPSQLKIAEYLIKVFNDAKEIGSLLKIRKEDYITFIESLYHNNNHNKINLDSLLVNKLITLAYQANILSNKYTVVCTNPPYLGKLDGNLKKFVLENYKEYSGDLFSVFMYRNFDFLSENGYSAFMTPFVWMFIKTYEKLRQYIVESKSIVSLIQMEYSAFEEATVPICSFILKNNQNSLQGVYFKLSEFKGGMEVQKLKVLQAIQNNQCSYLYESNSHEFLLIPGIPIAYWLKNYNIFEFEKLRKTHLSGGRTKTHNNELYLRKWWEIYDKNKWAPYANGGDYKKWYGNHLDVVNWSIEAQSEYSSHGGLYNKKFWNLNGICWNLITSAQNGFRIKPSQFHYSSGSPTIFSKNKNEDITVLGFLNSKVGQYLIKMFNPTLNTTVNDVLNLPFKSIANEEFINTIVTENIDLSKNDWDSFETSWDFRIHPFLKFSQPLIEVCFNEWCIFTDKQFNKLKKNEEELNRIFISIYDLERELTSEVEDKNITISKSNRDTDIRSFISYSIGCIMGRYSLDDEGIIFVGGDFDPIKYQTFKADEDGIILITDTEYFEDDLLNKFVEFVKVVYGEETLEENLNFIADTECFKRKSTESSRDCLRRYFLKGFMEDHLKVYQKRPIYWQFDSGKQNGFKALIYMHRYDENMVAKVRTDYLHPLQRKYEAELERLDYLINFENISTIEKGKAKKRQEQIYKQVDECKEYDLLLAHVAHQRIPLDLDDGVKVNYQKFQNIELTSDGLSKAKKGDLLYKVKM